MLTFCCFNLSSSQVMVKFTNGSKEDYKELFVDIFGKEFTFKDVKSGESTNYIKVEKTFRIFRSYVTTKKDAIRFLPFDISESEILYDSGKISIKISINSARNLEFEVIKE